MKKDTFLHIRLNKQTKEKLKEEAEKLGLNLSAFISFQFKIFSFLKNRLDINFKKIVEEVEDVKKNN